MMESKDVAKRTYRSRAEIENEFFGEDIDKTSSEPVEFDQSRISEETLRKIQLLFRAG